MEGEAEHEAESGEAAAKAAYERDETDEFITATKVGDEDATIRPGDSVFAFNFRPDRMRQITEALTKAGVDRYATLTEYEEGWPYPVAFPPARPDMTLAKLIAERGETQLHVAETEKYPHVTYFFNGGEEEPYEGEVRELVDSPRDVPTYDHKPEMSAREASDAFIRHWNGGRAGVRDHQLRQRRHGRPHRRHRGGGQGRSRPSTSASATWSRRCTGRAAPASSSPTTATPTRCSRRTARPTPPTRSTRCRSSSPSTARGLDGEGILADVAPTVLALLGIEQPAEMTGRSLLARRLRGADMPERTSHPPGDDLVDRPRDDRPGGRQGLLRRAVRAGSTRTWRPATTRSTRWRS